MCTCKIQCDYNLSSDLKTLYKNLKFDHYIKKAMEFSLRT